MSVVSADFSRLSVYKMSKIEKVFPTEEELSLVASQVRCSEENCFAVFKSTSNLNMHLIRHHKICGEKLCRKDAVRQFYCPVQLCIYNRHSRDSKKHFTKLKYLKQHFLKVHAIKNFMCTKCDKRFATEAFQKMHEKACGSSFHCSCGFVYNSVEALLTHCRRKGHVSLNSNSGRCEKITIRKDACEKTDNSLIKKSERLICPKLSSDISYPIHHIAAIALSELSTSCRISRVVDKGIQTECNMSASMRSCRKNCSHFKVEKKQNSSQETQTTGRSKNIKINTETQTNNEYLKSKGKTLSKIAFPKKRKKSMETQTKELLNNVSPNKNCMTYEDKKQLCKSLCEDTEKSTKFFSSAILGVDNLFQDVSSEFLKHGSNLSSESNNCIQLMHLNNLSEKSYVNKDELLNKRTKICLLPESSDKQDLFVENGELNICSKEFEPDLNELNMSCKKLASESEGLDLIESGSYNVFDINKLCNIETQTEMDVFLNECNDDSSFTLCSTTETQTIDFDPLLYSNMCTQTPDEVNQLFSFNFVDIETQTAWPDL